MEEEFERNRADLHLQGVVAGLHIAALNILSTAFRIPENSRVGWVVHCRQVGSQGWRQGTGAVGQVGAARQKGRRRGGV